MGFLLNDNTGYAGPQAGNIAKYGYPVYNQGGQNQGAPSFSGVPPYPNFPSTPPQPTQLPFNPGGVMQPATPPMPFNPGGPNQPIMNRFPSNHPLHDVSQLISDHANVLRSRLLSAHIQQALPAEEVPGQPAPFHTDPLNIVRQTRATGSQNLAQLLARFQRSPQGRITGHDTGFHPGASRV